MERSAVHSPWRAAAARVDWVSCGLGHLGMYGRVDADVYAVRLLRVPARPTTWSAAAVDRILAGVEEDVVLTVGDAAIPLGPLDLLSLPAGIELSAATTGWRDALVCEISSRRAAAGGPSRPVLAPWSEQRLALNTDYPDADLWGYHRGTYPRVSSGDVTCNLVMQPPAQTSPRHVKPWDCIFVQLRGETAFEVSTETSTLDTRDVLLVPAGHPYRYTNVGTGTALFASIAGAQPPGRKATYFDLRPRPTTGQEG